MSFLQMLQLGAQLGCNAQSLPNTLIAPLFSLIDVKNTPYFLVCNAVFWILVVLPTYLIYFLFEKFSGKSSGTSTPTATKTQKSKTPTKTPTKAVSISPPTSYQSPNGGPTINYIQTPPETDDSTPWGKIIIISFVIYYILYLVGMRTVFAKYCSAIRIDMESMDNTQTFTDNSSEPLLPDLDISKFSPSLQA